MLTVLRGAPPPPPPPKKPGFFWGEKREKPLGPDKKKSPGTGAQRRNYTTSDEDARISRGPHFILAWEVCPHWVLCPRGRDTGEFRPHSLV